MARKPGAKYPSDDKRNERRRREKERKRLAAAAAAAELEQPRRGPGRPRKNTSSPSSSSSSSSSSAPPSSPRRGPGRPPKPRAGRPMPALAAIADAIVPELSGEQLGGVCPSCGAAHADIDRNCRKCGELVRHACPKCDRSVDDDATRFCTGCGASLPEFKRRAPLQRLGAAAEEDPPESEIGPRPRLEALEAPPSSSSSSSSSALAPPAPDDPAPWDESDVGFFASGINLILTKMGSPMLSAAEVAKIDKRTAVMANKWLRPQGKWKEEILWAASWAPPLVFAVYIRYVVAPDRARAAAAEAAALTSKPNGDGGRTVDGGGAPGEHAAPRPVARQPTNLEAV
ncbi:MAG TPA: zinc ribbon domain-containing protein [Casimicrobiaceae bacterium]